MDFLLIGAGGHAKAVLDVIHSSGGRIAGYVDPVRADWLEAPQIAEDEAAAKRAGCALAMGIGGVDGAGLTQRLAVMDRLMAAGLAAPAIVHAAATVSPNAALADAVAVMPQAVVQPGVSVDRGAIINTAAIVEHDCEIGAGSHIAPGAIVLGGCHVGTCCMIGAGAVVLPGNSVADGETVAAGSRYPK